MLEASRRGGGGGVSEHNAHWVAHLEPVRTPLLDVDDLPEAAHPQRHAPPQGHVIVQVSTRSIRTELFDFGLRVMVLLAGVLLSGWVMARRISTSLDQRIQAVVQAAQKIGAGHIGIRLPASAIPSIFCPRKTQPNSTAVTGLSRLIADTATGERRPMPRNHRPYASIAPATHSHR